MATLHERCITAIINKSYLCLGYPGKTLFYTELREKNGSQGS